LREKKRYLLMRGDPDETVKALKEYLGLVALWEASPRVLEKKGELSIVVVRNSGMRAFRAANFLTNNEILLVSGSVRKLLKALPKSL